MKKISIFLFLVCFLLISVSFAVAPATEQIKTSEFSGILTSPSALMNPGNIITATDQKEAIDYSYVNENPVIGNNAFTATNLSLLNFDICENSQLAQAIPAMNSDEDREASLPLKFPLNFNGSLFDSTH